MLAYVLIAVCIKKSEGVVYGKLDKAGRLTNILLIPVCAGLGLFTIALGIFSYPEYDGFPGLLGWIVAILIASAPLFCGLGFSVALRKKGRSKQSFAVQFAGLAGAALSLILFLVCYDNLLSSLN